jgi:hypothetical protein
MAQTLIKLFLCPSDDPYRSTLGTIVCAHVANVPREKIGWAGMYVPPTDKTLGRTNYVGVAGSHGRGTDPILGRYEGLFTNRSRNALDRVADGTSNTVLFGEALGGVQHGIRLYA